MYSITTYKIPKFTFLFLLIFAFVGLTANDNKTEDSSEQTDSQIEMPQEIVEALFKNDGAFRDFNPEDEIVEKRTLESKHFKNSNGNITAVVGAGPVHYKEDGAWKTILEYIFENNTNKHPDYKLAAPFNEHKMYFPEFPGKPILVEKEGYVYKDWEKPTMVWLDAQGKVLSEVNFNRAAKSEYNKDSLLYRDIFPNTDALISNSITTKKLNYLLKDASILNQKPNSAVFLAFKENIRFDPTWKITGNTNGEEKFIGLNDGDVYNDIMIVNERNNPMIEIKTPLFFQQHRSEFDSLNRDRYMNGAYLLKSNSSEFEIFTLVPLDWLSQREFPVVIDPVTNYYPDPIWTYVPSLTTYRGDNSGDYWCTTWGTSYNRTYEYDISYGWADDTWPTNNPYFDGHATFNLTSIPDNSCVFSATYSWWLYYYRWCDDQITLRFGRSQYNTNLAETSSCDIVGERIRSNDYYYRGTGKNATGRHYQTGNTTHISNNLGSNYISIGWAYNGGDDCCSFSCGGDDGNWQNVYGYQSSAKPYVSIDYEGGAPAGFDKIWTGRVSTAWNNSSNWCPIGVPTSSHRVYIPNEPNDPTLSDNQYVSCITIHSSGGAEVTITSTGTLNVGNGSCPTYP
ncbi:MAG: hypothetical protein WD048_11110 [Chitinophagales bacterium]